MSAGGRGRGGPRRGYQSNGRGRGWNGNGRPVLIQREVATEETVKEVVPPVTTARSTTPFAAGALEEWAKSASTETTTCMYCWQRGRWMMGCAERLANEARTMSKIRGCRDERISDSPKIERTGAGTEPVRATGPEDSKWKKLIGFGNLFGLQDIYEGDEVRIQGGN